MFAQNSWYFRDENAQSTNGTVQSANSAFYRRAVGEINLYLSSPLLPSGGGFNFSENGGCKVTDYTFLITNSV